MERVEFQLQQLFLLLGELCDPRLAVKFGSRGGGWFGGIGRGLGRAEECRYAAILLGLLGRVCCGVGGFAFETHGWGRVEGSIESMVV